ncbi:hypothetical protein BKA57DRAFT_506092 [Linnemannia elongata]|nr:hypothetical protein BKA57DRAFT_506092 [Linnemannia elongata]
MPGIGTRNMEQALLIKIILEVNDSELSQTVRTSDSHENASSQEYLETQASERIWKPRCSATIAWEQTQGISAKDKTSKYTGPRGDWSQGYGYITRDGFCPCGASLATHEDRICPGATKEPRAADERLLETTIVAQSQVSGRTVTDGWFTEEFGL